MALPRKRTLTIRTYALAAAAVEPTRVFVPRDAAALALRARDAAAVLSIAVAGAAGETYHLAAGEVWAEDELVMPADLVLLVSTDADTTLEVRSWRDDRREHHDDTELIRVTLERIADRLEHHTCGIGLDLAG